METVGLRLHSDKTKIGYCKDPAPRLPADHVYVLAAVHFSHPNRSGQSRALFASFPPVISNDARTKIGRQTPPLTRQRRTRALRMTAWWRHYASRAGTGREFVPSGAGERRSQRAIPAAKSCRSDAATLPTDPVPGNDRREDNTMTTTYDPAANVHTTEQFASKSSTPCLAPRRCRRGISATDSAGIGYWPRKAHRRQPNWRTAPDAHGLIGFFVPILIPPMKTLTGDR
jgi:hypothetical protein